MNSDWLPEFPRRRAGGALCRRGVLVTALAGVLALAHPGPQARAAAARPTSPARNAARIPHPPEAAIYRLTQMNALDLARLDREKTIVLMPFGGIEPNGPHLPVASSGLVAEWITEATARRLRELKPDFSILIAPTLPYGTAPAVEYGGIHAHPTALYMGSDDFRNLLYGSLLRYAEGVWRYVGFISYDYSPEYHRRLVEGAEMMSLGYGLKAIDASGLVLADSAFNAGLTRTLVKLKMDTTLVRPTLDIHGGAALTSLMLAQRPELVDSGYKSLPPVPLERPEDLADVVARPGWPTYVGAPAAATPAYGRALLDALAGAHAALMVALVEGGPVRSTPTPAELLLIRNGVLRDAVWGMNAWEQAKRRPYDLWLKMKQSVRDAVPQMKPADPPSSPEGPH